MGVATVNHNGDLYRRSLVARLEAEAVKATEVEEMKATSWLTIAAMERGELEIKGLRGSNPRINEYLRTCTNLSRAAILRRGDEIPWCSAFVNWSITRAGYKGTDHALARSWVDWGFPAGLVTEAPLGAVLVIKRKAQGPDRATGSATGNHVTFLTGIKGGGRYVRGYGGNQRNSVRSSWYDLSKYSVEAVRWPWNIKDLAVKAAG